MSQENKLYSALHWAAKSGKYAGQAQASAQDAAASKQTARACEESCQNILSSLGSPALNDLSNVQAVAASSAAASRAEVSALQTQTCAALEGKAAQDFSNVTAPVAAFKSAALEWFGPDYTRPITLTSGQEYTADKCGWVQVYSRVFSYSVFAEVVVNGQVMVFSTVAGTVGADWTSGGCCFVAKGDVYKATASTVLCFYPCKGEI